MWTADRPRTNNNREVKCGLEYNVGRLSKSQSTVRSQSEEPVDYNYSVCCFTDTPFGREIAHNSITKSVLYNSNNNSSARAASF